MMARKTIFRVAGMVLLALAAAAPASACPFDKSAQTTDQSTTASSQLPLPTDGTTTGSKTGG